MTLTKLAEPKYKFVAEGGMPTFSRQYTGCLEIPTTERFQLLDITDAVNEALKEFQTRTGLVVVATSHTTSAIIVNEVEKGLFKDIEAYLERLAPANGGYQHDQIHNRPECPPDEPQNADAHLKALQLPISAALMYDARKLTLGTWQRVIFAEFDGPCPRPNKKGARQIRIRAMGD